MLYMFDTFVKHKGEKMHIHFMSITDFARYKQTSRQTIYNNINELTTKQIYGKLRIILDDKSENWSPKEQYKPKNNKNCSS